jgi:acyl carrier protein
MGLDAVELLVKIESEYEISFSDDEAISILTVGDLRDAIHRKAPGISREAIYERLRSFLIEDFACAPEDVSLSARIVADLGLD